MQSNLNDRMVPMIVAVSLFMENMDSTVISTSLPAIARALGTNPLALKLAVTSYLLSLAICIPASVARTSHRRANGNTQRCRRVPSTQPGYR